MSTDFLKGFLKIKIKDTCVNYMNIVKYIKKKTKWLNLGPSHFEKVPLKISGVGFCIILTLSYRYTGCRIPFNLIPYKCAYYIFILTM